MIKRLAGMLLAAGTLLALAASAAEADPLEPFTITEHIVPDAGIFEFTTTGGALCPSGTFVDEFITAGGREGSPNSKANFQLRTEYTCADGSGTFLASKHVFTTFNDDGSSDNTGPITFHGGTGAFTQLSGHGVDIGHFADGTGAGEISGVLKVR